jgi:Spy/CpxP family protein refolding chaperone
VRTPAPPAPPGHPHPHGLGKWWKDSKVAAELKLSEAQIKQIEQTFLEHRLKLIDLRANLEREETKLQPLVEADQPDEAQVGAQIDRVVSARGQLEKANTMMMLAIRRVLTVEQWKKLQSIKGERDRVFFFHAAPSPVAMPLPPGEFEEPI